MANLTALEKRQFEDLFGMASGYVMNFSNTTFAQLFRTTANIDIFGEKYNYASSSKANRLRAFWDRESDVIVGKLLNEMLRIWEYENDNPYDNRAYVACRKTANRLEGVRPDSDHNEESFLQKDFGSPSFDKLPIEGPMIPIMQSRYKEAYNCLIANSPLAVIILCGSMLEGILLGIALKQPSRFIQSSAAPRDSKDNKVKPIEKWTLENLINVACNISILGKDISKFSHALRDFRNYVHPYQQMSSQFNPDKHTAKICFQVLGAAIYDLSTAKLN